MQNHTLLFRSVCRFIKYFFLFMFGLVTAGLIASLFEAASIAFVIINAVKFWGLRVAIGSLLTLGCAVVFESVQ